MVELGGRPLLHWQVAALRAAGIEDITVVTGYRHELLEQQGFATRNNPNWASTNMVGSLWCARDIVDGPTIVSYSDIVYGPHVVQALAGVRAELGVAYDVDWLELWRARFADPLSDAESLKLGAGRRILDIGRRVASLAEIEGQYLGLLCFSPQSIGWVVELLAQRPEALAKLSMTDLLRHLIEAGHPVQGVETKGGWCEVDTPSDLAVAERLLAAGQLTFPSANRARP